MFKSLRLLAAGVLALAAPNGRGEDAFFAAGRHPALGDSLALYGQFLGRWHVAVSYYPEDGPARHLEGEWLFRYALEGRAIQDVWIVPARAARDPTRLDAGSYGTTIRFPTGDGDQWRIVWINPVRNDVTVMTARAVGTEIVQDFENPTGPATRWIFSDITPDRFRWRSEEDSGSGGWKLRQEMIATRVH